MTVLNTNTKRVKDFELFDSLALENHQYQLNPPIVHFEL